MKKRHNTLLGCLIWAALVCLGTLLAQEAPPDPIAAAREAGLDSELAVALQSQILDLPQWTAEERKFALDVEVAKLGLKRTLELPADWLISLPQDDAIKALIAAHNTDAQDWTDGMVRANTLASVSVANRLTGGDQAVLDGLIVSTLAGTGQAGGGWVIVFRRWLARQPDAARLPAVEKELRALVEKPRRLPSEDEWMQRLSVDLVALKTLSMQ